MQSRFTILTYVLTIAGLVSPSLSAQHIRIEPDDSVILLFQKSLTSVLAVEQSSDLRLWKPAVALTELISQTATDEIQESVIRPAPNTDRLFFRLKVENAWKIGLRWNPSPSPDVVGYRLHYGPARGNYTNSLDVGNRSDVMVPMPLTTKVCYFVVSAYNTLGLPSLPSAEVKVKAKQKRRADRG